MSATTYYKMKCSWDAIMETCKRSSVIYKVTKTTNEFVCMCVNVYVWDMCMYMYYMYVCVHAHTCACISLS